MSLLEAAQNAVSRATALGTHLDRDAVAEWFGLKARATGEERTLIEGYSEALMASAGRDADWIEERLARDAMADRMQDEAFTFAPDREPRDIGGGMILLDEVGPIPRGDAADGEEEQKHGGAGLDWSLIGKEVQAMIRLNPQDRSEFETEADTEPQE